MFIYRQRHFLFCVNEYELDMPMTCVRTEDNCGQNTYARVQQPPFVWPAEAVSFVWPTFDSLASGRRNKSLVISHHMWNKQSLDGGHQFTFFRKSPSWNSPLPIVSKTRRYAITNWLQPLVPLEIHGDVQYDATSCWSSRRARVDLSIIIALLFK